MRRITVVWMATLALTGATAAVVAPAAVGAQSPVLTDCFANGRLTGHYTVAQLRTALNTIPASATEYSVCYDVIQRQLLAQLAGKGNGSSSGSGGSFLPTPVIIVLVLLVLGAVTFGAIAIRRRAAEGSEGGSPGDPGPGPPDESA